MLLFTIFLIKLFAHINIFKNDLSIVILRLLNFKMPWNIPQGYYAIKISLRDSILTNVKDLSQNNI